MPRHRRIAPAAAGLAALLLAACSDATTAPAAPSLRASEGAEGRGDFHRYVALGTSVSAGVASDGIHAGTQRDAWPAQLARLAHREMALPLIAEPGCGSPIVAPLARGIRENGDPASVNDECAPNLPEVVLPAQNVAIDGARTSEALYTSPEDAGSRSLKMSRILPPGMSQVRAMMALNPKVVSVELGANDLLGVRSGLVIPGLTVVPFAQWAPVYDEVLDSVAATGAKSVVLAGLIRDVAVFPAFRSGSEIAAQRPVLQAFGVIVAPDCDASANILFVPVVVPTLVGRAAATRQPQTLSCADIPGTQDYTLTPADQAAVNALLAQMNAHIAARAAERGWAHFTLGEAIYEVPGVRPPYSVLQQVMTPLPYGPYISNDGYHPSAAGQALIARTAAGALNARYGMGIGEALVP